jgi:hypothetical protein
LQLHGVAHGHGYAGRWFDIVLYRVNGSLTTSEPLTVRAYASWTHDMQEASSKAQCEAAIPTMPRCS